MALRDQALSLLSAANNHSDLAVKLSSLRQAKDILLSTDPTFASDLFDYLIQLQHSPELLVRKMLVQIIEEIGLKCMEHSIVLLPVLLILLRDGDSAIAKQSIVSGVHLYCCGLEELAVQFHRRGKVERWLEELWVWMVKFKDAVFSIALEPGSVGTKLLALKFSETYVLLFTDDANDSDKFISEALGNRRLFNISWLVGGGHPILDPGALISDANRTFGILLDFLQPPSSLPGLLTITVINGLAAIARKRPVHYGTVLSALLEFLPNVESLKGCHNASIQYSLRTAFLGFLRCTCPVILESRDKLLRTLRAMNAGDAADQVLRQFDKIMKNHDHSSRKARLSREDQLPISGDQSRKRLLPHDNEDSVNGREMVLKQVNNSSNTEMHSASVNGTCNSATLLDSDLTAAEQMIAMIGALLAEGDRGAESLEILVSNIHPDLLADIVIVNMKHLPKSPPPSTRPGNASMTHQTGSVSNPAEDMSTSPVNAISSVSTGQMSSLSTNMSSSMDSLTVHNLPIDPKCDPRRDPRRLDPRRLSTLTEVASVPITDYSGSVTPESDDSISFSRSLLPVVSSVDNPPAPVILSRKTEDSSLKSRFDSESDQLSLKEEVLVAPEEKSPTLEVKVLQEVLPPCTVDEGNGQSMLPDEMVGDDALSLAESDQHLPDASYESGPEESSQDLPQLPPYVELAEEQLERVKKLSIERIINCYKHLPGPDYDQTRMALLARLVAQIDSNVEIIVMLQQHLVTDYQQQKGHELVLHVLYHLYSMMILDSDGSSTYASVIYEKFLLVVAKTLLDSFPASDKSLSKLLSEVPLLPQSALKLLDELCYSEVFDSHGKAVHDGERVTQGLGAVWSLILSRPGNRQACLDIALKCASHSQDDIRAKAIRLVANKLYQLNFVSENIEQFATNMLLSAVSQSVTDVELSQTGSADQSEREVENQEKSIGVPVSKTEYLDIAAVRDADAQAATRVSVISFPEAQRLVSLFFALCTKKPNLMQLIFELYGRAPKAVKQAFHRHIPILIRALNSSYSELLSIISNPPEGCENLLILVLQILTQETTPSANLIATVKHLYETKLKDATILIPILSSLSKNEVLPILPRLVGLPIEKFQMALAHILQGSAHTGPALTPAEVLVAIHDISPEKDGLPLKKITDACSACFEQRTVFTQQVLAKALNQMVDRTPLPLLFMRTVIQAIDAFPALVDFVMEILSKLVNRQVWRMPKLWVGFLKCVAQMQPRSFHVVLQLPPAQLEIFLSKYPILKNSLAAYASQPSMRSSLPRLTLQHLGLVNESHMQGHPHVSSLHPGSSSSAQGTNLT